MKEELEFFLDLLFLKLSIPLLNLCCNQLKAGWIPLKKCGSDVEGLHHYTHT